MIQIKKIPERLTPLMLIKICSTPKRYIINRQKIVTIQNHGGVVTIQNHGLMRGQTKPMYETQSMVWDWIPPTKNVIFSVAYDQLRFVIYLWPQEVVLGSKHISKQICNNQIKHYDMFMSKQNMKLKSKSTQNITRHLQHKKALPSVYQYREKQN